MVIGVKSLLIDSEVLHRTGSNTQIIYRRRHFNFTIDTGGTKRVRGIPTTLLSFVWVLRPVCHPTLFSTDNNDEKLCVLSVSVRPSDITVTGLPFLGTPGKNEPESEVSDTCQSVSFVLVSS